MRRITSKKANVGFEKILLYIIVVIALGAILFGIFQLSPKIKEVINSLPNYGTPNGTDIKLTDDEKSDQFACEVLVGKLGGLQEPPSWAGLSEGLYYKLNGEERKISVCESSEKCNDEHDSSLVYKKNGEEEK